MDDSAHKNTVNVQHVLMQNYLSEMAVYFSVIQVRSI